MRNSFRSTPDSLLGRWFSRGRGHPDAFTCGVRVLAGELAAESGRWRYRYAAVDQYQPDGVVTLQRGDDQTLRLRLAGEPAAPGERAGHQVLRGVELGSGAEIEISVPAEDLVRFGV